jgi:S-formylglutathione hydrolase FrmB
VCLCLGLSLTNGCNKAPESFVDKPRLTSHVILHDVTFRSAALARDMQYRIVLPTNVPRDRKLPAIYLLHGGGGGFRDWTNYSDVAQFAERGLILIIPEGNSSYYVNSSERPQDRYEDYVVKDLITDAESKFPIASR